MAESKSKQNRIETLKGIGRQSPALSALAMVALESMNQRMGLGLTAQEMLAGTAILVILGSRLQNWLEIGGK